MSRSEDYIGAWGSKVSTLLTSWCPLSEYRSRSVEHCRPKCNWALWILKTEGKKRIIYKSVYDNMSGESIQCSE
jgi:hypothetical protein